MENPRSYFQVWPHNAFLTYSFGALFAEYSFSGINPALRVLIVDFNVATLSRVVINELGVFNENIRFSRIVLLVDAHTRPIAEYYQARYGGAFDVIIINLCATLAEYYQLVFNLYFNQKITLSRVTGIRVPFIKKDEYDLLKFLLQGNSLKPLMTTNVTQYKTFHSRKKRVLNKLAIRRFTEIYL